MTLPCPRLTPISSSRISGETVASGWEPADVSLGSSLTEPSEMLLLNMVGYFFFLWGYSEPYRPCQHLESIANHRMGGKACQKKIWALVLSLLCQWCWMAAIVGKKVFLCQFVDGVRRFASLFLVPSPQIFQLVCKPKFSPHYPPVTKHGNEKITIYQWFLS